jgi:anti-sigma regulatory factor (Ser/Thr protein kinase)
MKPDRTEATEEPTLVLNLGNQPTVIEESRLAVVAFLEPLGIVPQTMNRVEVVLEELLSNLIRHGEYLNAITFAAGYRDGAFDLIV